MINSNFGKLISNYGAKLWGLVSVIIFIPIYINFIGIENYGIISFNALLFGIISFADAGMSSAIIREFAQSHDNHHKYSLFRQIEKLYIIICCIVCSAIYLSSNFIANHWLITDSIDTKLLSYYISLISISVTLQLITSLYFGALFGLGNQIQANSYQIVWNIFRSGGVVIGFIIINPTLEVYFLWQITFTFLYIIILRFSVLAKLRINGIKLKNTLKGIPNHVRSYIGGMTLIAIISAINSQADKIITSSFFSLKIFGYYNIASTLAQMAVILGSPLVLFVFPFYSRYANFESGSQEKLDICFEKISYLLSLIIIPSSIILILYAKEILVLWTGKTIHQDMLTTVITVVRTLSIGTFFLALQFPLFYLLLAKNKTKYTIYQGVVQISLGLPFLYICAYNLGLIGMGLPWILINFGAYIYLSYIVFRSYTNLKYGFFVKNNILIPIVLSAIVCLFLYTVYLKTNIPFLILAILSGIVSIIICNAYNNNKKGFKIFEIKQLFNFPIN